MAEEKEEKKVKEKKSIKIIIIIALIVFLILGILSSVFAFVNISNTKFMKGVRINGVDVSDSDKSELTEKYNEFIQNNQAKIIKLKYNDQEFDVTPDELQTEYNSESIISEAYSYGRNSNIFVNNMKILKALIFKVDYKIEGTFDDNLFKDKMANISSNLEGVVQQPSYYIEEDELIITKGKSGIKIEEEKLKKLLIEDINKFNQELSIIEIPVYEAEAEEIDLEKIHDEIYAVPQDAYITEDPLTVHPNVNGVDFAISMEEAKEILEEDKEEYIIPLKITVANKTLADLGKEAFPNLLGTFSTKFDIGNTDRSTNIKLATNKIDGIILLPGQVFSYNKTVGKRTIDAGFKEAGAYSGGKVVQEVGGGICQVSSTLYNAALYANLEIVERHNHTFESSYVAASRDATVSWGSVDFKFKNNRKYPIRIEASSKSGTETVSIYGIKEEDDCEVVIRSSIISRIERSTEYEDDDTLDVGEEVVAQTGHDGCTSEARKILIKDGETISDTIISKDTYNTLPRIIRRGTKKAKKVEEKKQVEEKTEEKPVEEKPKENSVNEKLNEAANILANYMGPGEIIEDKANKVE